MLAFKRGLGPLCVTSAIFLALGACGGGASSVNSTPTPTPSPSPGPASYTVNIFPNPKPETYATVGLVGPGFSSKDAAQTHVRYTADGHYELQVPGKDWQRLGFPSNVIPQDPATFNYFVTSAGDLLAINLSRLDGYRYSEIGDGIFAFGSATPSGGVPTTGSATYHGVVSGSSDLTQHDYLAGGDVAVPVTGTVQLQFDFGAGTLDGSMSLKTDPYGPRVDLGTFAFKNTVYSAGSLTYSGAFVTNANGHNEFLGRFTGPNAEETIGAWAVPFTYSVDGKSHQAVGAWVAKRP
jgi:transferrin binding protein